MIKLAFAIVCLAATVVFGAEKNSLLLIGNKSDDTLSFVDIATLREVAKTTTGRGPHEVVVTPDGGKAFVSNYEGPGEYHGHRGGCAKGEGANSSGRT